MPKGYRRALLKISGEALGGDRGYGLEPSKTSWIAREIAEASQKGRQLGVVIGGGNIVRGSEAKSLGVPRLVADQMGMIATVLNAMALRSALEVEGVQAAAMCAFPVGNFIETFRCERALEYLGKGYVTIFAGGTGNPYFTTDTAAALRAAEIEAQVMVKGTQADGVFDMDPNKYRDAKFIDRISPAELLSRRLEVIDAACVDILLRTGIPAIVVNLHKEGNLSAALSGEKVGSIIA